MGRRVAAFFIDIAGLYGIAGVLSIAWAATTTTDYYGKDHPAPAVVLLLVAWMVFFFTYWAIFESSPWQATIGKRAMGLRVVRADGRPLTPGVAIGRGL